MFRPKIRFLAPPLPAVSQFPLIGPRQEEVDL